MPSGISKTGAALNPPSRVETMSTRVPPLDDLHGSGCISDVPVTDFEPYCAFQPPDRYLSGDARHLTTWQGRIPDT